MDEKTGLKLLNVMESAQINRHIGQKIHIRYSLSSTRNLENVLVSFPKLQFQAFIDILS